MPGFLDALLKGGSLRRARPHSTRKCPPFKQCYGSKAQVWHGTAKFVESKSGKNKGRTTKAGLKQLGNNRIVYSRKSAASKKSSNLERAGYTTTPGKFGFVRR
ncbi:g9280 [Coccomyxa viridis]|uniref:G9280 protein n=1 Tax=Coccomyxa viridis TaxID=1274662 RepID=A0ABP1G2J0_9CHLO